MPAPDDVLDAYLERHAANDLAGVLELFEPDATLEDPVGSERLEGLEAIRTFYRETHRRNGPLEIERAGPALVCGPELAVHVRAALRKPGAPPAMDVIYVLRFAASGRIASLRAWF